MKQRPLPPLAELAAPTAVTTVTVRLLEQGRTERTVMATVVSRWLERPVLPGRLTRPRVARRGRVPGGARSSDQRGRMSGGRERLAPFLTHMLRHFRSLVAKTTAPTFVATKWRVCPFCFLGWHHRNRSMSGRVASLGNVNPEALQHASVRGMYGIRATCCRCAK